MSLEHSDLNILQTNCSNSRQNECFLKFSSLLFCYIFKAGKVNSEKREEHFENMPRTQHRKKKSNRKNFKSKAKISQDKMACGEGSPTFKGSFLFLKEVPKPKSNFSEFPGAIFTPDFRKNILKVIQGVLRSQKWAGSLESILFGTN